jgi:Right handed beta helix region
MSDTSSSQETVPVVAPPAPAGASGSSGTPNGSGATGGTGGGAKPGNAQRRRRAPLIVGIAVVLAAASSILGYELSSSTSSPPSSSPQPAPARGPVPSPAPTPTSTPSVPLIPGGVAPPASINDTCAQDVTTPLMNWLYTLPNAKPSRTIVDFGKGCYEVNGELWLRGFQNWVFEGGTIKQTVAKPGPISTSMMPKSPPYCGSKRFADPAGTPATAFAVTFFMEGGCDITFMDMQILGPNSAGNRGGKNIQDTAITFAGTQRGLVNSVTIRNPYGDYVDAQGLHEAPDAGGKFEATDITVENSSFSGAGREAIGVILASKITVKDNTFYSAAETMFDIEFDATCDCGHQNDILIADNKIVGQHYAFLLAAYTAAEIDRFRFTGNDLVDGAQMRVAIEPQSQSYNIEIDHNTATGAAAWPHRPSITMTDVNGALILDNIAPVYPWTAGDTVGGPFARVNSGVVSGNKLTLVRGQVHQPGSLVVATGGATACDNFSGSGSAIGSACSSLPTVAAPAQAAAPK